MYTNYTAEEKQRAQERTALAENLISGRPVEGLGDQFSKFSQTVESNLAAKGEFRAAEALESQRRLVTEKDLANRLTRITKRMEELQNIASRPGAPNVLTGFQQQMESLRPILKLLVRSVAFRTMLADSLRIGKRIVKRNLPDVDEKVEKIAKKTEERGVDKGLAEVKKAGKELGQNIQMEVEKDELITDEEWEQLSEELDATFRSLQRDVRYRNGMEQLFSLGSYLRRQFDEALEGVHLTRQEERAMKEIKEETIGLVGEFSGEKAINDLIDSINKLFEKVQDDKHVNTWWGEFKDLAYKISRDYSGKEELKEFRKLINEGIKISKKFSKELDKVIDQMNYVIDNITNDKLVQELREKVGGLSDELIWRDNDGNACIDSGAAKNMAAAVTEAIRKEFSCLALPPIQYKDSNTTLQLEDIVVEATLPDEIQFHLESYANFDIKSWNVSTPGKPDLGTELNLTASIKGIKFATDNMSFKYSGLAVSDSGRLSVCVPKADLELDFVLKLFQGNEQPREQRNKGESYSFARIDSDFDIKDMKITFSDDIHHTVLLPMMASLFKQTITSNFENLIENVLNKGLQNLGERIAKILNETPNRLSLSSLKIGGLGLGPRDIE